MVNISETHSVRLPEDNFPMFNEDMGEKGILRTASQGLTWTPGFACTLPRSAHT